MSRCNYWLTNFQAHLVVVNRLFCYAFTGIEEKDMI